MNRQDIIYNNIMSDIKHIKQNKPVFYNVKNLASSYINMFGELFTLTDRFAIVAIAAVCLTVAQVNTPETNTDVSIYTFIYETNME